MFCYGVVFINKHASAWQIAGFLFTSVAGTLLHFLFDWTGENIVVGLFSAVNESIWEHMKLIFFPMLLFALAEYRFWGKLQPGFWCVQLAGIALALALIPTIYYTYTGALGISADWFNITIFFIAAGAAYYLQAKLFARAVVCPIPNFFALAALLLVALVFWIFTFFPPQIPPFQDPLTGTYGYQS